MDPHFITFSLCELFLLLEYMLLKPVTFITDQNMQSLCKELQEIKYMSYKLSFIWVFYGTEGDMKLRETAV